MNCKKCNTRMPAGSGTCPHCGWVDPGASLSGAPSVRPAPPAKPELAPSSAPLEAEIEAEVDLELDDEAATSKAKPQATGSARAAAPAPSASSSSPLSRSNRGAARKPAPAPSPGAAAGLHTLRVGPAELRALLAEEPELLEPGLSVFVEEGGRETGVGYETDVGAIDLLARDAHGALVVVMVARPDAAEEAVAEVLQRVGWARKHLGKGRAEVRGIVLLEPGRTDLSYAAAAVAGTVAFKTWRFALSFDDVDV